MRFPDFIMIGAAKAGTTSLSKILGNHPDIFMSTPKEPEFFARPEHYAKGIEHYARLFEEASGNQICGEASTLYTLSPFFPDTARHIHTHLPNARLIYVMRNPVERSFSYYQQMVKNYQNASGDFVVHRSFEEHLFPNQYPNRAPRDLCFGSFSTHIPDHPELFIAGSEYLRQIKIYLDYFDRAQIHFVKFEDFRHYPAPVIQGILDFLGIDPFPDDTAERATAEKVNISQEHFDEVQTTLATRSLKKRLGPAYGLAKTLLPRGAKQKMKSLLGRSMQDSVGTDHRPQPMLPGTRLMLYDRFRADWPELAELTGLELSDWETAAQARPDN